ncbi:MAG: hypothetical protein KBS83_02505 [Lachnospiraceae bacterium]|nr:hypothetical protein [Candidatus Equihabitans merdae]
MCDDNKIKEVAEEVCENEVAVQEESIPGQALGEKVIEKYQNRVAFQELLEEEQVKKANEFKNKLVPVVISVLGCILAIVYLLWMFGFFKK